MIVNCSVGNAIAGAGVVDNDDVLNADERHQLDDIDDMAGGDDDGAGERACKVIT